MYFIVHTWVKQDLPKPNKIQKAFLNHLIHRRQAVDEVVAER